MNISQKTGRPFARAFIALLALLATSAVSLAQSNATLSGLVSSTGAISPAFTSANETYTAIAPLASDSMTVTPTATEAGATITVNGTPVASGTPSAPISLNIGNNVVTTVVVSADTTATKTYTLTVARNGPITVANTAVYELNSVSGNTFTMFSGYSVAGVDKLVVTISGEHGFPNGLGLINSVTFAGQPMATAIKLENGQAGHIEGVVGIFYLDNPSQFGASGDIVVTNNGAWNSFAASAMSLVGTAPGVGNTNSTRTNIASTSSSVSLNTSTEFNIVIAATVNGVGNTAQLPTAQAPQTPVLSWRKTPANFWCAGGSGYQFVQGLAGATSTFTYASTNASASIAASFGVGVPTLAWDLNGETPGAGGDDGAPSGNWDAVSLNWNATLEGTGPAVSWINGRAAMFAAGTDATGAYTVTVSDTHDIAGLSFEEGTVTVEGGTALRLSGFAVVNAAAGLTATVATPLSEDASGRRLVKAGPGSVILSGNNSYTGDTTMAVGGGTLVLSGNNVAATGGMALNGGVTRFESPASINGTARNVSVHSGGAVMFGASFGAGNIPAALANRIVATSAGAIAADNYPATAFNFNTPGLTAASLGAVGAVDYTGNLTPNGTTYRLGGGGGTLTMVNPNAVTGSGSSLVINGNVTLLGANNFTNGTTLNTGNLGIGADTSLGAGPLTVNSGSISSASAASHTLANPVTLAGNVDLGNAANNGKLTFTGSTELGTINRIVNVASEVELAGPVTGSGFGFTKNGAGILTLSGANTYTGTTTVNSGILVLTGSNNTAGATTITNGGIDLGGSINGGLASGTLTFGALIETVIRPIDGDRTISNNVVMTYNASAGGIGTVAGAHHLTINGTFTHSRPGGGNGTLISRLESGKVLTLAGQVRLSESNTVGRMLTIDGTGDTVITGQVVNGGPTGTSTVAGGLTKSGTGTLTLKGINTYTGATTVNAGGCLALVGGSQTSAITVTNGAFLGLTPGSPSTSTAALNLAATSRIRLIGPPIPGSTLLITASAINGTPVLETPINGYSLVTDATTIRLVGGGSDYEVWTSTFLPIAIGGPDDDFDGDGMTNDQERLFGLDPTSGASSNPISVPFNATAGTFTFTRRDPALTGMIYKVWTSIDLQGWDVDEGATITPGAVTNQVQPVAVTLSSALLTQPRLFFKVTAEGPPPPLLASDFENDDGGFTVVTLGGTPWSHGVVSSPSIGGGATTSGNSGTKCWGTNLTGAYTANTDTSLRSPIIDLTGITGATLSFARSIDANNGHKLEVNVIGATTDTVIANIIPAEGDPNSTVSPWETIGPVALPAAAYGQPVRIEWRFIGNGNGDYNGVYIDDVMVTETSP